MFRFGELTLAEISEHCRPEPSSRLVGFTVCFLYSSLIAHYTSTCKLPQGACRLIGGFSACFARANREGVEASTEIEHFFGGYIFEYPQGPTCRIYVYLVRASTISR